MNKGIVSGNRAVAGNSLIAHRAYKVYTLDANVSDDLLGAFLTGISQQTIHMEVIHIQNIVGQGIRIIVSYEKDIVKEVSSSTI